MVRVSGRVGWVADIAIDPLRLFWVVQYCLDWVLPLFAQVSAKIFDRTINPVLYKKIPKEVVLHLHLGSAAENDLKHYNKLPVERLKKSDKMGLWSGWMKMYTSAWLTHCVKTWKRLSMLNNPQTWVNKQQFCRNGVKKNKVWLQLLVEQTVTGFLLQ